MNKKLKAFTIFEVTVVLAIMSIIITIITVSINRFNEQLKLNSDLFEELNDFYAVRSTLWSNLVSSDSIELTNGNLNIYKNNSLVTYYIEDEQLHIKINEESKNLKIQIANIKEQLYEGIPEIVFDFSWKDEVMTLSYLNQKNLSQTINKYFENLP